MKKIILAISLFAAVSFSANAQKSDAFFTSSYMYEGNRDEIGNQDWNMSGFPSIIGHGNESDYDAEAPIGSGLLLLGGMALAYGMRKRKDN